MKLVDMSLNDYIIKAQDKSSVPGGGSVAALCGALAASLAAMVLNLSGAEDMAKEYDIFSKQLRANIDDDSTSFDGVLKAFRMPKTTEEEKKARRLAIEEGYKEAIDVPILTMQSSYLIIYTLIKHEAYIGDEALSDLYLAADLALTAFNGAKDTAMINVEALKDDATRAVYEDKIESMMETMTEAYDRLQATYENAMVTCGTADGEIKTTVDGKKMPANDDESNFGKGCGYQIWDEGYLNVQVNDRWVLFKALDLEDHGQIPKWVAHFTARVIEADEDLLLVKATAIEDAFYFKDEMTKRILLPIENLDHGKDGFVTTKGLEGKTVEIYFGGEIKNTEPESSVPIVLETVYKIRPID